MFKWIKKKIFQSIINDIKNEIPELKSTALNYWEENKDELFKKCIDAVKNVLKSFVSNKTK